MIPHERSLVEKLKDKPFTLLGVNADAVEDFPEIAERHDVNWRSWLDGENGTIAEAWKIQMFPSVYLIDQDGVIRHKNLNGDALDAAIDEMLAKVKTSG